MLRPRTVKTIALLIVLTVITLAAFGWDIVLDQETSDTFINEDQKPHTLDF